MFVKCYESKWRQLTKRHITIQISYSVLSIFIVNTNILFITFFKLHLCKHNKTAYLITVVTKLFTFFVSVPVKASWCQWFREKFAFWYTIDCSDCYRYINSCQIWRACTNIFKNGWKSRKFVKSLKRWSFTILPNNREAKAILLVVPV
jgi:hypothetical protein